MRAIFAVLAKELRENLRDRRTVLSALLFGPVFIPLLFAGMLFLMVQRGTAPEAHPVHLAVSHAERAPNLLRHLREYGVIIHGVDYDDQAARAAVQARRDKIVLRIPPDYGKRIAHGVPAAVLLYADSSDQPDARNVARIRALLGQYNQLVSRLRLIARGVSPLVLTSIAVQNVDVATPEARSVIFLGMLSYLILLTMLMGGLYVALDATAGERERGSLEPLLTVPVRREWLIYGKILAACAFMLLSLILTVIALSIVLRFAGLQRFGMAVAFGPAAVLKVIAFCAPFAPLGAALMTLVAAYTRSYREAQTFVGLILLVPTVPLVFAAVEGLRPTAWLMAVPSLSQHFLIMSQLRGANLPAAYVAISVCVTLALGVLLSIAAGRLYHREALLG